MKTEITVKQIKQAFEHRGSLSGKHAFTLNGLDGLRDKVRSIESGSGISAGYNDCNEIKTAAQAEENSIEDFDGAGWYLSKFDGSSDRFDTEAEALVAYIEERTETRNVEKHFNSPVA